MKWNHYSCNFKTRKLLDTFEVQQLSNKWEKSNKLERTSQKGREHWNNLNNCIGPMSMHWFLFCNADQRMTKWLQESTIINERQFCTVVWALEPECQISAHDSTIY